MIRKIHSHTEKGIQCYSINDVREKKTAGLYIMNGMEFTAAYNGYCNIWHAYDETGFEIASFRSEFYEKNIKRYRVSDLVDDPECKL